MASAAENGQIEIKFSDQMESNPVTIFSSHTNVISGGAKAAPTGATFDAIPFTSSGAVRAGLCRGRLIVYFTSDATDIIESEESQAEIPCILYEDLGDKAGKVVANKLLTFDNMTGFTAAGAVDVSCTAGVPVRLCYYDVPKGLLLGLDPRGKVRVYIGDDTA